MRDFLKVSVYSLLHIGLQKLMYCVCISYIHVQYVQYSKSHVYYTVLLSVCTIQYVSLVLTL